MRTGEDEHERTGEAEHVLERKYVRLIVPRQIAQLWNLFLGGGVEVRTPGRGEDLYLRTVIQPDGDVLSFINVDYRAETQESYARMADAHRHALTRVHGELRNLFRRPTRMLVVAAALGAGCGVTREAIVMLADPAVANLHEAVARVVCVMLAGPVGYQAAFWLARYLIKRKISALLRVP